MISDCGAPCHVRTGLHHAVKNPKLPPVPATLSHNAGDWSHLGFPSKLTLKTVVSPSFLQRGNESDRATTLSVSKSRQARSGTRWTEPPVRNYAVEQPHSECSRTPFNQLWLVKVNTHTDCSASPTLSHTNAVPSSCLRVYQEHFTVSVGFGFANVIPELFGVVVSCQS